MERIVPRRLSIADRHRIRQCVGSAWLECGCFVGRYLTSSTTVMTIVDARMSHCPDSFHRVNVVLTESSREEHDAEDRPGSGGTAAAMSLPPASAAG